MIGTTYSGCSVCADNVALLSECENELQIVTNVVKRHPKQDRITIHPDESSAVLLNKPKLYSKSHSRWNLGLSINGLVTDIQVNVHIWKYVVEAELSKLTNVEV